jgi:very-short-patch-repair endonuclease
MGEEIALLATIAGSAGLFNAAQAALAGVTVDRLALLIRRKAVLRLAKGWYTVGPIESREQRHLLTARALVNTFAGRAVASHQTAVLWHGLPLYLWAAATVHLTRSNDDHARRRRGLVLHPAPAGWVSPTEVVPPAVAVVQYGQQHGRMSAIVAGDALLHRKLATLADLGAAVELLRHVPGNGASRSMLELLDESSESPGESRLRIALKLLGFAVTPQVAFPEVRARVDFVLDTARVIIEFDGQIKYETPADVFKEKQREDQLRELGYEVVRFVWADLDDLELIRGRVERAIRRAESRSGRR